MPGCIYCSGSAIIIRMDGELLLKLLQLYGFPCLMCVWFMWRAEKRLEAIEGIQQRQLVVLATLVRILGSRRTGQQPRAVPDDFIDEVTGVNEIPLPGERRDRDRRRD